jgi:hypothetical protein
MQSNTDTIFEGVPTSRAWIELFEGELPLAAIEHVHRVTSYRERYLAGAVVRGECATPLARWCLHRIVSIAREFVDE